MKSFLLNLSSLVIGSPLVVTGKGLQATGKGVAFVGEKVHTAGVVTELTGEAVKANLGAKAAVAAEDEARAEIAGQHKLVGKQLARALAKHAKAQSKAEALAAQAAALEAAEAELAAVAATTAVAPQRNTRGGQTAPEGVPALLAV